jgi:hypothetical protein
MTSRWALSSIIVLLGATAAAAEPGGGCHSTAAATQFLASKGAGEQLIVAQGLVATNEQAVKKGEELVTSYYGKPEPFRDKLAYVFRYLVDLDSHVQERIRAHRLNPLNRYTFEAQQKRAFYEMIRGTGFVVKMFGVYRNGSEATGYLVSIPLEVATTGDVRQGPEMCIEEALTQVSFLPFTGIVESMRKLKDEHCATEAPKGAINCTSLAGQIDAAIKRNQLVALDAKTAHEHGEHLMITGGTDAGAIFYYTPGGTAWEQQRLQMFRVDSAR